MRTAITALLFRVVLFVTYALAVWFTAYHGMRGDDVLGLVCILLLLAGAGVVVYVKVFQHTVTLGRFSVASVIGLGLGGMVLGTASSGEAEVGMFAGLLLSLVAAAVIALVARRRRRDIKTVFISYRRADSGEITPHIQQRLAEHFGAGNVFFDIDSIPLGEKFGDVIRDAVNQSDALIAVIGEQWLDLRSDTGSRRIDGEDDLVRIEIETGLRNPKVLVVPLAVDGGEIPQADELPNGIRELASRNGGLIRPAPDFDADMERLIRGLKKGAITPWSRATSAHISWRLIAAAAFVVLLPLALLLFDELTAYQRTLTATAMTPDGHYLATAQGSGHGAKPRIAIWDAGSGELIHEINLQQGPVSALAWSAGGRFLAYGDHAGNLVVLGGEDWRPRATMPLHAGILDQIAWSHTGERLAAADWHGGLRVWDARLDKWLFSATPHINHIDALRWSPDDRLIATGSWDSTVAVSDSRSGERLHRLTGHQSHVTAVDWSADGLALAAGGLHSPYLFSWEFGSTTQRHALVGHSGQVKDVAWSPTDRILASISSADDTLRIWNFDGTLLRLFEIRHLEDLRWSPDGQALAVTDETSVSIWDPLGGELKARFVAHPGDYRVSIVGWSAGVRRMVTLGHRNDTLKIWDLATLKPVATIRTGLLPDW